MRKILLILSGIILITIGFFYYINLQAKETVVETPSSETSKKTLQRDYKHLNNKLLPTIDTSAWKTYDNVFGEHRYKFKYPNNITISDFDDQSGNIDLFANNELMLSLSIYPWEFYQPRYNGEELLDYINGTSDNFDGINMDEYDTIKFDTNKYFYVFYTTQDATYKYNLVVGRINGIPIKIADYLWDTNNVLGILQTLEVKDAQ